MEDFNNQIIRLGSMQDGMEIPPAPSTIRRKGLKVMASITEARAWASKKIGLWVFTDDVKIKQFSFPLYLIVFSALLLVSCAAFLSWIIPSYWSVKAKMPLLVQLQTENEEQKNELLNLERRIQELTPNLSDVWEPEPEPKVMTNTEQNGNEELVPLKGVGGSKEPSLSSDDPIGDRKIEEENEAPTGKATSVVSTLERIAPASHSLNAAGETTKSNNETTPTPEEINAYPYSLQLGSYNRLKRADKAVSNFRAMGLSPYKVRVDLGKKGVWFRVFTGHFKTWNEAKKFKEEHGLTKSVIKKRS
jgi:cell division septation protein DedD